VLPPGLTDFETFFSGRFALFLISLRENRVYRVIG